MKLIFPYLIALSVLIVSVPVWAASCEEVVQVLNGRLAPKIVSVSCQFDQPRQLFNTLAQENRAAKLFRQSQVHTVAVTDKKNF